MVMARDRGQRENQRLRPRSGPRVHEDSTHILHQGPPGHTRIPTGPITTHQGSRRQKTGAHGDGDGDGGGDDDEDEKKAVDGSNNRNCFSKAHTRLAAHEFKFGARDYQTQLNGRTSMHIIFREHLGNYGENNRDSRTSCFQLFEARASYAVK